MGTAEFGDTHVATAPAEDYKLFLLEQGVLLASEGGGLVARYLDDPVQPHPMGYDATHATSAQTVEDRILVTTTDPDRLLVFRLADLMIVDDHQFSGSFGAPIKLSRDLPASRCSFANGRDVESVPLGRCFVLLTDPSRSRSRRCAARACHRPGMPGCLRPARRRWSRPCRASRRARA